METLSGNQTCYGLWSDMLHVVRMLRFVQRRLADTLHTALPRPAATAQKARLRALGIILHGPDASTGSFTGVTTSACPTVTFQLLRTPQFQMRWYYHYRWKTCISCMLGAARQHEKAPARTKSPTFRHKLGPSSPTVGLTAVRRIAVHGGSTKYSPLAPARCTRPYSRGSGEHSTSAGHLIRATVTHRLPISVRVQIDARSTAVASPGNLPSPLSSLDSSTSTHPSLTLSAISSSRARPDGLDLQQEDANAQCYIA